MSPVRVRLLSDLRVGDVVLTPRGREAEVKGFGRGVVQLAYCRDGDEVEIAPHLLKLLRRAAARQFPAGFFKNIALAKGAAR